MRHFSTFLAVLTCASLSTQAQTAPAKSTLKGVVSYYFNANYGDKPDTGAKAYILTGEDLATLGTSDKQLFRYLIAYAKLGDDPISVKAEMEAPRAPWVKKEIAKRLGEKPALLAQLNQIDDSVSTVIAKLDVQPKWEASRVTSDGSGVFSKKVAPGTYYVVVVSAHRQHHTKSEINGQYYLKKVEMKEDDVELPFNFSI